MLELITEKRNENLGKLLGMLPSGTLSNFEGWLERVYDALEADCQLDAGSVDLMAEILEDIRFAVSEGVDPSSSFDRLLEVYKSAMSPERRWSIRRDCLTEEEIQTELWEDFQDAVALCESGDLESAECWAEEADENFARAWDQYSRMSIIEEEVALESCLGHRFLREGIEAWRAALQALRAAIAEGVERTTEMWNLARQGQKSLIIVQMLEDELRWSQPAFAGPPVGRWAA